MFAALIWFGTGPRNVVAACATNVSVIDLSTWSVVQYTIAKGQGPAHWTISQSNTVALQDLNADASIFLSPASFIVQSDQIQGSWRVDDRGRDDDFIGFVFGYQDDTHFYLFDWKRADQTDVTWGFAQRGMSVKVMTADSPLTAPDLGATVPANTNRVRSLYHNLVPWVDATDYQFNLSFMPGHFTITVTAGASVLDTITINDNTYRSGRFGFYNYSQSLVQYSGFTRRVFQPSPIISVADRSIFEGNSGTTNLLFSVSLSATNCDTTRVDYAITPGSATFGQDYAATTSGTLVFAPGETNKLVTVTVFGDLFNEPDETVFITLSNAVNGVIGAAQAVGTILNDDPLPTLQINDVTLPEGDSGSTPAIFNVTLSAPSEKTVQVGYATTDGTALAGSDYIAVPPSLLSFPPGQTNAVISVTVLGDTLVEPDETFFVCLTNPVNAALANVCGIGTILNDDTNKPPSIALLMPAPNPCLLLPTNILLVPQASDPDGHVTRVEFFDYTNKLGEQFVAPFEMTWSNVQAGSHWLTAVARDNAGAQATSAPVAISASFPSSLSINDQTLVEGNTGATNAVFTISLSPPSCRPVSVTVRTSDGTALAGSDYAAVSTNFTFAPGDTVKTLAVPVVGDTLVEPDETFFVCLTNPVNAAFAKVCGLGTILNDDTNKPPSIALAMPASDPCLLLPTNLLLIPQAFDPDGHVTRVEFFDYTNKLGEQFVGSFEMTWSNVPPGNHVLTAVARDDSGAQATSGPVAITASFPSALSISDQIVVEGNTGATNALFTVTLSPPSCRAVSVMVRTSDGTALAGSDYAAVITNLIFAPGETVKTLAVSVFGDVLIEPDETFFVCLTNPVNAFLAKGCGLGTIVNDDTNKPPLVAIVSPLNGATISIPPTLIPITANATDPDGFVRQVSFYSGTNLDRLLGTVTNASFTLPWSNTVAGTYVLSAVATDNLGATATSAPVRVLLKTCSGGLVAAPLVNQTACVCETVTLSTSVSSSDPVSFVWKANGQVIPGQTTSNLILQSLKPANAGVYSVEISSPCQRLTNTATLAIGGDNLPNPLVLSNTNLITINDYSPATPYPAIINVSCVPGLPRKVTASIFGLTHTASQDVDMLLASPAGQAIKLLSDAGSYATNTDLNFSDDATASVPAFPSELVSGTYKPTDYTFPSGDVDSFPSAPPGPYLTNLAGFSGANPNGSWALYVVDDATEDVGFIAHGWSLTIEWDDSAPHLVFSTNLVDGRFQMNLLSQPGRTHLIEASTDLESWSPLSTNTMVGTNMAIVLPGLAASAHRFYRVVRCPNFVFHADAP